jgi:hypothetical protein
MPSYSPNMKLCATCERWAGARKVNPTRAFVSTASPTTQGECLGGAHSHAQTPASGTCGKYRKWSVLR